MEVEPITFAAFTSLYSGGQLLSDNGNDGCAWYATADRSVLGRIVFDHGASGFRYTVLRVPRIRWELNESLRTFGRLEDAELALKDAMRRRSGKKKTTLHDDEPRLRSGKRQTQTADRVE